MWCGLMNNSYAVVFLNRVQILKFSLSFRNWLVDLEYFVPLVNEF